MRRRRRGPTATGVSAAAATSPTSWWSRRTTRRCDSFATRCEAAGLGGVPVGTVDKFQGREAPVVFYSMATSSAEDVPRSLEFLFSRNRLNVAVSRAMCLAFIVASPRLLESRARTIEQMRLINALCRFVEMAETRAEARRAVAGQAVRGDVDETPIHLPGQAELDDACEQVGAANHRHLGLLDVELAPRIREDDDGPDDLSPELGMPHGQKSPDGHGAGLGPPAVTFARAPVDRPPVAIALHVAGRPPGRDDDDATRPGEDVVDAARAQGNLIDQIVVIRQPFQQRVQALSGVSPERPEARDHPGARAERDQQREQDGHDGGGGVVRGQRARRAEAGGQEQGPRGDDHGQGCSRPVFPCDPELAAPPKNLHPPLVAGEIASPGRISRPRSLRRPPWTWRF